MGVDNEAGALGDAKDFPAFLEDMGEGQEVQYTVVFAYRHALVIGLEGGMILSAGEDNAFGVACGARGI
jgi:hypothetical protein